MHRTNEYTFHLNINITHKQEESIKRLLTRLATGQKETVKEMATLTEAIEAVKTAATDERQEVQAALGGLKDEILALKEQIANGGSVTEEQMQELVDAVESIHTPEDNG